MRVAMGPDHFSASDGFVIAMLGMIFLSMGVVGMLLLCMKRNASRRDPHVDRLLEEVEEEERLEKLAKTRGLREKKREAWEKDGDWWKKR